MLTHFVGDCPDSRDDGKQRKIKVKSAEKGIHNRTIQKNPTVGSFSRGQIVDILSRQRS
jgi:hypothetical protein